MINIKLQLEEKPYLASPLLIWKNLLMFKAFVNLKAYVAESRQEIRDKSTSMIAYYWRIQRKGLYSLKMFAQRSK